VQLIRADIERLIPHAGPMCLLDGVRSWDDTHISCFARTHVDPANPLRRGDRLPVLCALEYAAQAIATHGGLSGAVHGKPAVGYLASVRDLRCLAERLDCEGELVLDAERLAVNGLSVMYRFAARVDQVPMLQGRATVILEATR
jgi:predicted hotdog family 3-hydroxylacyl-ACP dehydratase